MKKVAYLHPVFLTGKVSDRVRNFFRSMKQMLDFNIIYSEHLNNDAKNADILFIYAGVHGKELLSESLSLKSPKIVYLLTGAHSFKEQMMEPIAERANLLLVTYYHQFSTKFSSLKDKFVFFPLYFAPHSRYTRLKLQEKPILKCLLTGHKSPKLYPIRREIIDTVAKKPRYQRVITVMRHPRWHDPSPLKKWEIEACINKSYAETLNKYFCSIATNSIYHYGLAKYFEIPAAGSLLLGVRTPDMDKAGLEPWTHYIPISRVNLFAQIEAVLTEPHVFSDIRKIGCSYVRHSHSVKNRIRQLQTLIEERL